ncbi:MAG: hypothetical protein IJU92_05585 [Spirochaetaceae bacterium]|nr:hypothetical protein [Spirochaetaceae bacterium]
MKKRTKFLFGILAMSAFLMVQAPTVGKAMWVLGRGLSYAHKRAKIKHPYDFIGEALWDANTSFWAYAAGAVNPLAGIIVGF